jgi:hypothetical protein
MRAVELADSVRRHQKDAVGQVIVNTRVERRDGQGLKPGAAAEHQGRGYVPSALSLLRQGAKHRLDVPHQCRVTSGVRLPQGSF